MLPIPKSTKELDFNGLDFSKDMKALISFVKARWEGLSRLKPKGYKEFCKDYEDYQGMEDESLEDDVKKFKSFDDGTASSFSFPIKVSLPHVAYDDICQGRKPFEVLLSAFMSHGHARGKVFGKHDAINSLKSKLSYVMNCTMMNEFKNESEQTKEVLHKFTHMIEKFIQASNSGRHTYKCKCKYCSLPKRNP